MMVDEETLVAALAVDLGDVPCVAAAFALECHGVLSATSKIRQRDRWAALGVKRIGERLHLVKDMRAKVDAERLRHRLSQRGWAFDHYGLPLVTHVIGRQRAAYSTAKHMLTEDTSL